MYITGANFHPTITRQLFCFTWDSSNFLDINHTVVAYEATPTFFADVGRRDSDS
jgi:hypothetical protein